MSNYTFTFRKDDITVEFTTTDKYIVERQFQLWVNSASEYTQQQKALGSEEKNPKLEQIKSESKQAEPVQEQPHGPTPVVEPKIVAPQPEPVKEQVVEPVKAPIQESVQKTPTVEVKEEPVEQKHVQAASSPEPSSSADVPYAAIIDNLYTESSEENNDESVKVVEAVMVESAPEEAAEVFDKASTLLKTINNIQNPEEEVKQTPPSADFEKVLEKTIEHPTFEPSKAKDDTFLSILASKNTTDKFHYLIITAYYLSEYEKMDRFSLKQINAKLMQNISELVDHSVLQSAIEQQLIVIIPDLTGMSDIAEYKLTDLGESFFVNRI